MNVSGVLADRVRAALVQARTADGGFAPAPGGGAEPEPTALAAIALDDGGARAWLRTHQQLDGSWTVAFNYSATGLAALALGTDPPAADAQVEKALDFLTSTRSETASSDPHPSAHPWGWAPRTYGWVDPTARALLAFRRLRPTAGEPIATGVTVLGDRACDGGGWNYGNRSILDQSLVPYVQPSAVAMMALHGLSAPVAAQGRSWLDAHWSSEVGGLTLACTLVARRLLGDPTDQVETALGTQFDRSGFLSDTVSLAWALIGLGDGIARLRVASS